MESDRNLVALAEREAAEARGKQLDKENFAALFGKSEEEGLVDTTEKMRLVRTVSNGKGGSRGLWKGTYESSRYQTVGTSTREEASLLDL